MIEVFKTNVLKPSQAKTVLKILEENFNGVKINFDLTDCDKVLRVQGQSISPEEIIKLVTDNGYHCEVLM
jgi:hypothetical protein